MSNHPNRSKTDHAAPAITPEMVFGARINAGHTQYKMARTIWRTVRSVEAWEDGTRTPDPGLIELYLIKTGQIENWRFLFPD